MARPDPPSQNSGAMFGETITDLDHAGFMVPSRGDLEAWQVYLESSSGRLQQRH